MTMTMDKHSTFRPCTSRRTISHKHSFGRSRFLHLTPDRRSNKTLDTRLLQFYILNTSYYPPWNKPEQSMRWRLSSPCQSRPLQLAQLLIWSPKLPRPLTHMSSASFFRHQTCRIYATMLNTAITTHCSSCSPGEHGPSTKV